MGLERFGVVNLDRGTSSSLCTRSLASGYFIGDGLFLVAFSSWDWALERTPLEGPGIGVLTVFLFSE